MVVIQDKFRHCIKAHLVSFPAGIHAGGDRHMGLANTYGPIKDKVMLMLYETDSFQIFFG